MLVKLIIIGSALWMLRVSFHNKCAQVGTKWIHSLLLESHCYKAILTITIYYNSPIAFLYIVCEC